MYRTGDNTEFMLTATAYWKFLTPKFQKKTDKVYKRILTIAACKFLLGAARPVVDGHRRLTRCFTGKFLLLTVFSASC